MTDPLFPHDAEIPPSHDEALLDSAEAAEIVPDDPDHPMDSEEDEDPDADDPQQGNEEIQLENNSLAHFDHHSDSIFCIANHPLNPTTVATGGGDDTTYIFAADVPSPVLPQSYESSPTTSRSSLPATAKLTGHTDSINALTYTLPSGDFLLTGGLDGQLRVHSTTAANPSYPLLTSAQEVPEINFLSPSPHPSHPNTFALGASDGSVWVYTVDPSSDPSNPLQVLQAYYLHTDSCTAGAWTPDGKLLATVSEDGSLYVWDPFGEAAAAGISSPTSSGGQALAGLTSADQRFAVEDGLFSVAVAPSGAFVAVGGAHGMIRIVGLPRLSSTSSSTTSSSTTKSLKGSGAASKAKGGRQMGGLTNTPGQQSAGQAGAILASLQTQSDSIETLSFSPQHSLLAAGSVDGSICLFDTAHRFTPRRHIKEAHEGFAVVKVAFGGDPCTSAASASASPASAGSQQGGEPDAAWFLTSCGMDGVVRRWDCRGGAGAAGGGDRGTSGTGGAQGLMKEWRGHRGEGEGGGVLGFVMLGDGKLATAGDDAVSLVFG